MSAVSSLHHMGAGLGVEKKKYISYILTTARVSCDRCIVG